MAEALAVFAEEEIETPREAKAEPEIFNEPPRETFNDTADHFEGMVVRDGHGSIVDYIGNFGSARAAAR